MKEPSQSTIIAVLLSQYNQSRTSGHRHGYHVVAMDAETLCRLGRAMNRVCEAECNYGQTDKTEARFMRLLAKAESIAADYGLLCSSQRDPRGPCLRVGVMPDCKNGHGFACL